MTNTANATTTGIATILVFTGMSFYQDNRMFRNKRGKNPCQRIRKRFMTSTELYGEILRVANKKKVHKIMNLKSCP